MKKHIGSTLDSLLEELGEKEEVGLLTQKKLLAAKVERAMAKKKMTKMGLAKAMHTSRTVVHRLLDPKDTGVTLRAVNPFEWKTRCRAFRASARERFASRHDGEIVRWQRRRADVRKSDDVRQNAGRFSTSDRLRSYAGRV